MGIAYAIPYIPPPPPVSPWRGLDLSWTGWDGSEWDLTSPSSGLFLMPGVRGLGMPQFERQSSTSPMVAGSRHRGSSTKDRDCFWPLYLYSDKGSTEFVEHNRAFLRSLDTDEEGMWTAQLPDGSQRTLRLRLTGAEDSLTHDPVQRGWIRHAFNLLADQPYWLGEPVRKSWSQGDMRSFYVSAEDRVTYGYANDVIYYLSPGGTLDSAVFTNDGDVPAYPIWTVIGETTAVNFGVGDRRVIVPFTIPAGYAVQLDTDPVNGQVLWYGQWSASKKALVNPIDRTAELNPASAFVAIPRGQDRALSFQMTGTGTIIAEVRSRYRSAF